ncbi:MAG TPA: hypothetical protein VMM37_00615 [Bacteroidota bacterium]|nr:hypothetical protein [Bacteroidota bacterium]
MRRFSLLAVLFVLIRLPALAQCDEGLSWDFDEDENQGFSLGGFLSDTFTPKLLLDTKKIRAYIRDPRFKELADRCGDLRAVDGIYLKALKIADHDVARALFLSLMGTLEHQSVEFKVPLFGILGVPMTFEEDSLFQCRRNNLPSRIYPDTPPEGDKDKLQHFFASAYLAYASDSPELAKQSGNFVEWGESKFIAGGADDPRDKRSNKHGEAFGRDLLIVKTLLPSDYLRLSNEQ